MSIEALILGKLQQRAEQRTGKSGRPFVTAKARAAVGEGESLFVNVIAFSESAGAALLALEVGDAVALAGTLKPGMWTDREGIARVSLDIVAAQVLTVYGLKKKREAAKATEPQQGCAPPLQSPGDDFGPAGDDAWLRGEA
jgi:single-stranded DNA-binding protein